MLPGVWPGDVGGGMNSSSNSESADGTGKCADRPWALIGTGATAEIISAATPATSGEAKLVPTLGLKLSVQALCIGPWLPPSVAAGAAPLPAGARGYFVVQLRGPVTDAAKAGLAGFGVELLDYVPNHAFLVRATAVDRPHSTRRTRGP